MTFTLRKIPFVVARTWFIAPLAFMLLGYGIIYQAGFPNHGLALLAGLLVGVSLPLSLLGHEVAHAAVNNLFGGKTEQVLLNAYAAAVVLSYDDDSPRYRRLLTAAAGPAFNAVAAVVAWVMWLYVPAPFSLVMLFAAAMNVFLVVGNLLPFPPTDGFQMLRLFWPSKLITALNLSVITVMIVTALATKSEWLELIAILLMVVYALSAVANKLLARATDDLVDAASSTP